MNRKGFLLAEETLKLILAVIAIGFLAYLLFALYQSNQDSKDLKLAKESLEHVVEELSLERAEIEIYNPNGWYISSWPNTYVTGILLWKSLESGIPLSCSNLGWQSCICICDTKSFKDEKSECESVGACLENPEGFFLSENVKIENPPVILGVDYETKEMTQK